jgi:hypothetical protein
LPQFVEAFVQHLNPSDSATEVVVAELHADIAVRQSDRRRPHVRGNASGLVDLSERAGVVTLRGRRARTRPQPELTVDLPRGCALTLRRITGAIRVGDIDGALRLDLAGAVDVRVGRVAAAHICLRGDCGRIAVAAVDGGGLDVEVIGTGHVTAGGTVEHLLARVLGSGIVDFHGDAQVADLSVDGTGYINVLRVLRDLRRWCVGAGDARVAHPPRPVFRAPAHKPLRVDRVGR